MDYLVNHFSCSSRFAIRLYMDRVKKVIFNYMKEVMI